MARADRNRLRRLHRLTHLRAIEKDLAVRDAAGSEAALARLTELAERTRALAATYACRPGDAHGGDLAAAMRFENSLGAIAQSASSEAGHTRISADRYHQALAQAERRRAAAADRAEAVRNALQSRNSTTPAGARRAIGTALEE